MMWANTPNGKERIFCKICLMEGQPWLTREPCDHILKAEGWDATIEETRESLSQELDDPNAAPNANADAGNGSPPPTP